MKNSVNSSLVMGKISEIQPQIVLSKPFKIQEWQSFREKCISNNWKIAGYPSEEDVKAYYGILQTQEIRESVIVDITEEQFEKKKEELLKIIGEKSNYFCKSGTTNFTYTSISGEECEMSFNQNDTQTFKNYSEEDNNNIWCDENEKSIELTPEDYKKLYNMCRYAEKSIWNNQIIKLKQSVLDCKTLEELNGIEIKFEFVYEK